MDVAYAFLNHHHSIWINGEQFCIWHSYFTDNMQNIFTYTHIDCLIYRKGEKNDAKNAPFTWTRTEPKAENLVQLIESKVSFVVPFNSDCELRLCRARFSQESLGMFSELRGIGQVDTVVKVLVTGARVQTWSKWFTYQPTSILNACRHALSNKDICAIAL